MTATSQSQDLGHAKALETAQDIAVNVAPVSVALSKRLLWTTSPGDQGVINELERRVHLHVMGQPDTIEDQ